MLTFWLGIASGATFLIGDTFYIHDIINGSTRPHRMASAVFALISLIDLANQFAAGATNSLWLFVSGFITTVIIAALSVRRGMGGTETLDWIVLAGATLGLGLWVWLRTPLASILCNLAVSVLAMVPIFIKSYQHPYSEHALAWLLCAVSSLLGLAAVGRFELALWLLPGMWFVAQLSIWLILVWRRRSVARPAVAAD